MARKAKTGKFPFPYVFSIRRGVEVTDGLFESEAGEDGWLEPVLVKKHGIAGTHTAEEYKQLREKDPEFAFAKGIHAQSAKLPVGARNLIVSFGLRTVDLDESLFSCASFAEKDGVLKGRAMFKDFIARVKASRALDRVAERYARNIANGRWLWRNRVLANEITVRVFDAGGEKIAEFDALKVPRNHFDDVTAEEKKVASLLAGGWRGEKDVEIRVEAVLDFGVTGTVEVFPSQEYFKINDNRVRMRESGKVLYAVECGSDDPRCAGQAALHDRKIANALRTVDTWYPGYDSEREVIPVEPMGASLSTMTFHREGDSSAVALFRRLGDLEPDTPDGTYCVASIIRGGVYGEKEKVGRSQREDGHEK